MNMNSHRRQGSSGSFNTEHYSTSFSSLENFMIVSKLMQDEIMVPSKLMDKVFEGDKTTINGSNGNSGAQQSSDVLDHYRFILLIRSQLTQTNPFKSIEEHNKAELKNKKFKAIYDNMKHHYTELMGILDQLSNEAKMITDIYKENV